MALISTSDVSNEFLSNDKLLNVAAVEALEAEIQTIVKQLPLLSEKGKVRKLPIPEQTFIVNRRKKVEKFDAEKNKADNLAYLGKRAIPVKASRRLTDRGARLNRALLTIYPEDKMAKVYGDDPMANLRKRMRTAVKALNIHIERIAMVKAKVGVARVATREQNTEIFDKALKALRKMLTGAGIDSKNLVESKGMMGKTILLKIDKDNVVSIGRSDPEKFSAAVKAAAAAESEPAKKKVKKGDKEEKSGKKGLKSKSDKKASKKEDAPAKKKGLKSKDKEVTKKKKPK